MTARKSILVLDLGSESGRAFVFSLPQFEIIGSARFDVSRMRRWADNRKTEDNETLWCEENEYRKVLLTEG